MGGYSSFGTRVARWDYEYDVHMYGFSKSQHQVHEIELFGNVKVLNDALEELLLLNMGNFTSSRGKDL